MISKKFRLRRWQVQKIMKREESKKMGMFIIKMIPNKLTFHRFSLVLSRKFAKLAIDRNKKKRQIYEAIRNNLQKYEENKKEAQKHFDIVLIPYKQILTCSYQKIDQNVNNVIKSLYT